MNITDVSIKNPVFAWMLMASTMLFGIVAISRVGISQYPDVDYPNISVSVSWPGASPAAVEREIVEPLEQAISQVEGVKSMSSKASAGNGRITVVFDMSRDVDLALQDVQARVGSATRSLPKDVPAASVSKSNPDDQAIITIGVTGPFSAQVLADVARYQVQEKLQTVAGVGQISLTGYVDRNIRIWLDASRLSEKVSGAVLGLVFAGKSLNLFSMIGLLLLMGIVKKNSILLVEYANHIREEEKTDALTAASRAGPLRLRPILMTTIATMMAAVPPILGLGPGTETRSPMAAAVLGGLAVSTVLSLLVVPAFYVVSDRIRSKLFKKKPEEEHPLEHTQPMAAVIAPEPPHGE